MAGRPDMFMEDTTVGGVPCFARVARSWVSKNKRKRETFYRIQTIILTYITYSLYNMARRPITVVKTKIIEECKSDFILVETAGKTFNISNQWCDEGIIGSSTEEALGFVDSIYIAFYGLCLYFSGIIADCYNPRFYLTAGCLLSGYFCFLMGLSDFWGIRSFKFMAMCLMLSGASQSTGWPVVLSCVTHWYSGGNRGTFFGFWNTHNYLGSIFGIYIASAMVDKHWGWSFYIPGFILIFMGLVVYTCLVADPGDLKKLDKESTKNKKRQQSREKEAPPWLKSNSSITMYDALRLPGVVEFSSCMFFSRIVGYIFSFWLPLFIKRNKNVTSAFAALYTIAYFVGGSIGGIIAGIFIDIFQRSTVVCAFFLLISIPVLGLGHLSELGQNFHIDFPIIMAMGIFVEAPYVVTSTSVSADLGTHKMIKRNRRALSTIGGIIEGTGALGAAIGTYICGALMIKEEWTSILYLMMVLQFVAILCIVRQAYNDFSRKQSRKTLTDYWKGPSVL